MSQVMVLKAHGYCAEVVPEYGMNCIHLSCENTVDALRSPVCPDDLGIKGSFLFGMPTLFFPNRLSGGTFSFDGRTYTLPINEPALGNYCHGELYRMPFRVVEVDETHIIGRFEATEKSPYLTFPHAFVLSLEYRIEREGLLQIATMKNCSDLPMPFALAFHTTFRTPFVTGGDTHDVRLQMNARREIERNMATFLPTGKRIDEHEFKDNFLNGTFIPCEHTISRLYELGSQTLTLTDIKAGTRLTYTYDKRYRYCMMYNGGDPNLFCLEPQTWLTNCPNISDDPVRDGLISIVPGEEVTLTNRISVDLA